MPKFEWEHLPQQRQKLEQGVKGLINMQHEPFVAMSKLQRQVRWKEEDHRRMWLTRIAALIGGRHLQLEIALNGISPGQEEIRPLEESGGKSWGTDRLPFFRLICLWTRCIVFRLLWVGQMVMIEERGAPRFTKRWAVFENQLFMPFERYMDYVANGAEQPAAQ